LAYPLAISSSNETFVVNGKALGQLVVIGTSGAITQYRIEKPINIRLHAFSLFSQIIPL